MLTLKSLIHYAAKLLCLSFLLMFSGGCDHLNSLWPNASTKISIPSDSKAYTSQDFDQLHYAWMYRNSVEAYQHSNTSPQKYDQSAIAFLDQISKIESHVEKNPDWPAIMNQGAGLLEAGCSDPLISLWYGVAMFHCDRLGGAENVLKIVAENLKKTGQPAVNGFFVARTMLAISFRRQGNLDCNCSDYFDQLVNSLASGLNRKEFFDPEVRICYRLLEDFANEHECDKIWKQMQTAITNPEQTDPYFVLLIKGQTALVDAWKARGSGWADTVTKEGWQGFDDNLAVSREALTKAWKRHLEYSEAPTLMIAVAMAGKAGPKETETLWFNRSVKAQMDYGPAYDKYFQSLLPRWGGSFQKILHFGTICLETKRYDTDVPMQYLVALRRIASDQKHDRWRLVFRNEAATKNLNQLFSGMLADQTRGNDRDRIMTQQALTVLWQGNYDHGRELLAATGKRINLSNGFAGISLSWCNQDWNTIDTEIALFSGPEKATLQKAENFHLAGQDREATLLFEEVRQKYRNDPAKFSYLLERMAFQMMAVFPEPAHSRALHVAAASNELEALKFLIANGADLEVRNQYGDTPLNAATYSDQLEAAKILIEAGADINTSNNSGRSPLYNACLSKKTELAELLINKKANINSTDHFGLAPLHVATIYQLPGIVNILLSRGAHIDIRSDTGMTPLHYAIGNNDTEMVKLILSKGADINLKSNDGVEPLLYYAGADDEKMTRLMLDHGARVNIVGRKQWTPLHYAAYYGRAGIAQLLLQKGADRKSRLDSGETPLEIAQVNHRDEVVKILSAKL